MVDKTTEESIGTTTEITALIDRIAEAIIQTIKKMTVMLAARTTLEKGHFPETIATLQEIEVQAIVGPGQNPEQVLIETEFDVISVGNMITSQRAVPLVGKERK